MKIKLQKPKIKQQIHQASNCGNERPLETTKKNLCPLSKTINSEPFHTITKPSRKDAKLSTYSPKKSTDPIQQHIAQLHLPTNMILKFINSL